MRLAHYYHLFTAPGWEDIFNEHLDHLEASGLAKQIGCLHLGIVGTEPVVDRKDRVTIEMVAQANTGWEQVTLNRLHEDVVHGDPFDAVLYAHTKGVSDRNGWTKVWRRSMTLALVDDWRKCVSLLEGDLDAVGCHWLTQAPEKWVVPPRVTPHPPVTGIFGGNFWWAKADYLRRLPPPLMNARYDAELWLGQGNPKVYDFTPGWPGWNTVLRGARGRTWPLPRVVHHFASRSR